MFSSVSKRRIANLHCLFCSLFRFVSELHFFLLFTSVSSKLSRAAELNCGSTGDDDTCVILNLLVMNEYCVCYCV